MSDLEYLSASHCMTWLYSKRAFGVLKPAIPILCLARHLACGQLLLLAFVKLKVWRPSYLLTTLLRPVVVMFFQMAKLCYAQY